MGKKAKKAKKREKRERKKLLKKLRAELGKKREKKLRKAWKKTRKHAMDHLTSEQEKLLKGLTCDGCGRHCPLTSPRCKNGRRRAAEVLAGAPAVRERVVYDTFEEYLAAQAAKKH